MSFSGIQTTPLLRRALPVLYGLVVLLLSFMTYVKNYTQPAALYWDENYHIAAAQKYLNGVFFMEPHPPLGKLLIALGEKLTGDNSERDTHSFLTTDHLKSIPKDYSFRGVRLFPVIAAWLSAMLFFLSLLLISRNPHTAFLFSFLYIFDNAMIVHFRGAMLDSIQLFFLLSFICYSLWVANRKERSLLAYAILGLLAGLALAVKANSAIVLLIFPLLFVYQFRDVMFRPHTLFVALPLRSLLALLSLLVPFFVSWWIHFSLGKQVLDDRFYGASDAYKEILTRGESGALRHFPLMLRDSYRFFHRYERGVPKLDICKVGENGSFPLTWPVGKKSINYRWEKTADGKVRYLVLQSNPVIWGIGLLGVVLSLTLVLARIFFGLPIRDTRLFGLIATALAMYCAYICVMLQLDRTMYLYHYFIPLMFTFYIAYSLFHYGFKSELERGDPLTYAGAGLFALQILAVFFYYSPLTYYLPLAAYEVYHRAWFGFWELVPIL